MNNLDPLLLTNHHLKALTPLLGACERAEECRCWSCRVCCLSMCWQHCAELTAAAKGIKQKVRLHRGLQKDCTQTRLKRSHHDGAAYLYQLIKTQQNKWKAWRRRRMSSAMHKGTEGSQGQRAMPPCPMWHWKQRLHFKITLQPKKGYLSHQEYSLVTPSNCSTCSCMITHVGFYLFHIIQAAECLQYHWFSILEHLVLMKKDKSSSLKILE